MARTRRAVENLAILMLSIVASGLLIGSLMLGVKRSQGIPGHSTDSIVMTLLLPGDQTDDLLPVEAAIEIKESFNEKKPDDLKSAAEYHEFRANKGSESADYLPVSLLTQRPIVLRDIDPELPEILQSLEPQSFHLTLFINEYGDVDHIELSSIDSMPEFMMDELRRHFEVMRFMPGQLDGRVVRSALRIRVRLDP